ncbi:MAG TPA: hypothetical protein VLA33_06660 [Gemmatimonadota bacterium]|nr:hypothetical protein [Gemmatimonadota bacterium]
MVDETQGTGAGSGAIEPFVEDNGPWFVVFMTVFVFLFASAFAFLVHSLLVTFGPGIAGGSP